MNHAITLPATTPPTRARRRRLGPWLAAAAALFVLATLALAAALPALEVPFTVTLDGLDFWDGHHLGDDLAAWPAIERLGLAAGVVAALAIVALLLLVVLPLLLVLGALALAVVLLAALGLPLLAVAGVLALVASPLLLGAWLIWRALR